MPQARGLFQSRSDEPHTRIVSLSACGFRTKRTEEDSEQLSFCAQRTTCFSRNEQKAGPSSPRLLRMTGPPDFFQSSPSASLSSSRAWPVSWPDAWLASRVVVSLVPVSSAVFVRGRCCGFFACDAFLIGAGALGAGFFATGAALPTALAGSFVAGFASADFFAGATTVLTRGLLHRHRRLGRRLPGCLLLCICRCFWLQERGLSLALDLTGSTVLAGTLIGIFDRRFDRRLRRRNDRLRSRRPGDDTGLDAADFTGGNRFHRGRMLLRGYCRRRSRFFLAGRRLGG